MADNNHGNREALAQVTDDDPFAELTRIMGQTPPADAEPGEDAVDAFALDLEKELMGEVDPDDRDTEEGAGYAAPAASFGEDSFAADPENPVEYQDELPAYEAEAGNADADEPLPERDVRAEEQNEPLNFETASDGDAEATAFEAPAHGDASGNWEPADDYQPELAAAEQGYWSASASDDDGRDLGPDRGDGGWQTAAAEPLHDEDALADVDMDFGDLDDVPEPVFDAAPPHAADQAIPPVDPTGDVSLEDELEMLLGDEQAAPDAAPAADPDTIEPGYGHDDSALPVDLPEPAQPPLATIFTRANLSGNRGVEPADHDVFTGDDGQWDHHAADAMADEPHEISDEPHEDLMDQRRETDPFEALAHIAPDEIAAPVAASPAAAPDFETVEVPETALAQHDDLDLPDLPVEEEQRPGGLVDDFESEFAYDFAPASAAETNGNIAAADPDVENMPAAEGDDHFYAEALGFGAAASAGAAQGQFARNVDTDIDREIEDGIARPERFAAPPPGDSRRRTGFIVAAAVLGIAILGGIGAFALSLGGGDETDTPVLVKADDEPLKVKPENPGGTSDIPNQDSVAYEAAAGGGEDVAPQQESLVSATEEPVDIASRGFDSSRLPGVDDEVLPEEPAISGKSEDRLGATSGNGAAEVSRDVIAVQPRKVRTMIVKPDGTLVAREEAAPVEQQPVPTGAMAMTPAAADPAPAGMETMAANEPEKTLPTATDGMNAGQTTGPEPVTATETAESAAAPANPVMPSAGPVVPSRPAAKPAQPKQQVAQAAPAARKQPTAPAPIAAASSEWSMQIASQPSAESAQETYQNLARRYGSVLGGRGVNIIRADIAGKGTYYRVRIPATSRDDGVSLCERYKAAGGSCFVSK